MLYNDPILNSITWFSLFALPSFDVVPGSSKCSTDLSTDIELFEFRKELQETVYVTPVNRLCNRT